MKNDPVIEKLIGHDRELADMKTTMKSRFDELIGMVGEVLVNQRKDDEERSVMNESIRRLDHPSLLQSCEVAS